MGRPKKPRPKKPAAKPAKKKVRRKRVAVSVPPEPADRKLDPLANQKGVSKKRAFLAAFRVTASIARAAEIVGIERGLHYRWLAEIPAYKAAFEDAKYEAADTLEAEAIRRAIDGVVRPVFYQGVPCGHIREYSDGLLQVLLRAWNPSKFRERSSVEHTGPDGGPIDTTMNVIFVRPEK